jgi:hypothetical protein
MLPLMSRQRELVPLALNGNVIGSYPSTIKLDRRFSYNLAASPIVDYAFVTWQKNNANTTITPTLTDNQNVTFKYVDAETVIAEFVYDPPPPPPPPPPPNPLLTAVDKAIFIPNAFTPNGDNNNE